MHGPIPKNTAVAIAKAWRFTRDPLYSPLSAADLVSGSLNWAVYFAREELRRGR